MDERPTLVDAAIELVESEKSLLAAMRDGLNANPHYARFDAANEQLHQIVGSIQAARGRRERRAMG